MKKILFAVAAAAALVTLVHPGAAQAVTPALEEASPASTCEVVFPDAQDDFVSTSRNAAVTFSPLWNDSDTPAQDLISFGQPSHGTVEAVGIDALRYTPDASYVGADSFSYTLGGCLQCFEGGCSEPEFANATVHISVN